MAAISAGKLMNFEGSADDLASLFPDSPLAADLMTLDASAKAILVNLIRALARLVPSADVASPGWSSQQKPLLVLGKADKGGRIRERTSDYVTKPLIGLCRVEGSLQLFIGHATLGAYEVEVPDAARVLLQRMESWDQHRDRSEGPELVPDQLATAEPIGPFLSWVQSKLPQATQYAATNPGDLAPVGARASSTSGRTQSLVIPAYNSRYYGALLRNQDGAISTRVIEAANWRDEFTGQVDHILALVTGTGESARTDLFALMPNLQQAQESIDNNEALTTPPSARVDGYVYLYFRDAKPSWRNVFYIGMSANDPKRGASHLEDFLSGQRVVRSAKTFEIDRALTVFEARAGRRIESMENYLEVAANSYRSRLFQHAFTGLTPMQAFMVERYLIQRLGPYSVSNETGGNGLHQHYQALVLPANLGQADSRWRDAVEKFLDDGCLSYKLRAELNLTEMVPVAEAFNQALANSPLHMRLEADGPQNCRVTNGQDMTLNYLARQDNAPFRLELLSSRKEPAFRINLRPIRDLNRFASHLRSRGLAVTNAGYCKPFAPQGNGRRDVFFPAQLDTEGSFPSVPVPDSLCWLPDQFPSQMNILDACDAVLQHLLQPNKGT